MFGGQGKKKCKHLIIFFFYTFLGSVFMLLAIFILYGQVGTTDYQALCCFRVEGGLQCFIFLGFFISLAIKIPKIPFHI